MKEYLCSSAAFSLNSRSLLRASAPFAVAIVISLFILDPLSYRPPICQERTESLALPLRFAISRRTSTPVRSILRRSPTPPLPTAPTERIRRECATPQPRALLFRFDRRSWLVATRQGRP